MTLPNFLIIGTQKGGTTWLQRMLSQHRQVYMPSEEVYYFNLPRNFVKGRQWYERHFAGATSRHLAVGEKTPTYVTHDPLQDFSVAERIHDLVPNAKLIASFRNPVDRCISGALHHRVRGRIDPRLSMDTILDRELRGKTRMFVHLGYYYQGLAPFYRRFPGTQILPLIFEKHIRDERAQAGVAKRVCEFLGVDPAHSFTGLERRAIPRDQLSTASLKLAHALKIPKSTRLWRAVTVTAHHLLRHAYEPLKPSAEMRQRLHELYAPENAKFFELLGYEVGEWQGPQSGTHHRPQEHVPARAETSARVGAVIENAGLVSEKRR